MAKDPDKLGIFVTSPIHINELVKIVEAALRKGKKVKLFFTYKATHLVFQPDFQKLRNMVPEEDLAICLAALVCEGFEPEYHNMGLTSNQMRTQAFHGELIEEVGKYFVL
uniref:Peroxiredoxin n=1 Tax=Caldimicrobium thiodismutans TaxID=1653476 RepID=A0A832LVW4_9BACT